MTLASSKTPSVLAGRGVLSRPVSCGTDGARLAVLTVLGAGRRLEQLVCLSCYREG